MSIVLVYAPAGEAVRLIDTRAPRESHWRFGKLRAAEVPGAVVAEVVCRHATVRVDEAALPLRYRPIRTLGNVGVQSIPGRAHPGDRSCEPRIALVGITKQPGSEG